MTNNIIPPVPAPQLPETPPVSIGSTGDLLSQAFTQERAAHAQALRAAARAAAQANPAVERKAAVMAKRLGVPEQTAMDSPEVLGQLDREQELLDLQRRVNTPELDAFLQNIPRVRRLVDDVGTLQKVSGALDFFRRNWESGSATNDLGRLEAKRAFQKLTPEENLQRDALKAATGSLAQSEYDDSLFAAGLQTISQMFNPMWHAMGASAVSGGAVAAAGFPEAAPFVATIAGAASVYADTSKIEFGTQFAQIEQTLLDAGVEPGEARRQAIDKAWGYAYGVAAPLEVLSDIVIGLPVAKGLTKVGGRLLGKSLPKITVGRALARSAREAFTQVVAESGTEALQQLAGDVAQNQALTETGHPEKAMTMSEALADAVEVAWKTARGMALVAPLGPAFHFFAQQKDVQKAQEAKRLFDGLRDAAEKSKAAKEDPDTFASAVNAMAAGKVPDAVYMDGARLQQVLTETGQREQFNHDLPDAAKALEDAVRDGGDVKVSFGDFAAKIAPMVLYEKVQPFLRLGQDGIAMEDAEQHLKEMDKLREETTQKIRERAAQVKDWNEQASTVQTRIRDELKGDPRIGEDRASLIAFYYRSWVETQAAREGSTPAEVDQRHRLAFRFQEQPGGEAQGLQQTQSPLEFHSALAKSVDGLSTKATTAAGWKQALAAAINKGTVKQEEVEWTGLSDWLDMQQGKVSKEQVQEFLRGNGVQVETVQLGGRVKDRTFSVVADGAMWKVVDDTGADVIVGISTEADAQDSARAMQEDIGHPQASRTKFGQYVLPGGENYREVLLTLPRGNAVGAEPLGKKLLREAGAYDFRSSHFEQPNIIAHLRLNDRTDADGARVLFVEEIQSDWAQKGRKEGFARTKDQFVAFYRVNGQKVDTSFGATRAEAEANLDPAWRNVPGVTIEVENRPLPVPGIPRAPFVESTKGWLNLALKKVLMLAVEGGYDKVAFINGEQSASRYDLSKQVHEIRVGPPAHGAHRVVAIELSGERRAVELDVDETGGVIAVDAEDDRIFGGLLGKPLEDIIGKEMADRVMHTDVSEGEVALTGEDLKVGGEGMKAFYDKIVPQAAEKLVKKLGGETATVTLPGIGKFDEQFEVRPSERRPERVWLAYRATGENVPGAPSFMSEADAKAWATNRMGGLHGGINLTEKLRETVQKGLPLFAGEPSNPQGEYFTHLSTAFIYEKGNVSTALHEMSHHFMSVMFQAVRAADASESLRNDVGALLDWFGIGDPKQALNERLAVWDALGPSGQVKHWEAFSYNFEAYLFEGKAPKPELESAFAAFRRWLVNIYTEIRDKLNPLYRDLFGTDLPMLTDEVRAVFDRLVSADEIVQQRRAEQGLEALFKDKPEGVSDTEWAAYKLDAQKAEDGAKTQLGAALLRATKWLGNAKSRWMAQLQKETRKLRAQIEDEERARLEQESVYKARAAFAAGEVPKLDREAVRNLAMDDLRIEVNFARDLVGVTEENGTNPDAQAEMMGYASGTALVRDLLEAPPLEDAVQRAADERMLKEHSDLLDQDAMEAKVEEALHGEYQQKIIAAELRFLGKINTPVRVLVSAARAYARELVSKMTVRELRPDLHIQNANRHRRNAERALAHGDTQKAIAEKRRELLETQLARVTREKKEQVAATRLLAKKLFGPDAKLGKTRDVDYIAAARFLAARFDLGPKTAIANPAALIAQLHAYNPDLAEKLQPILSQADAWDAEGKGKSWRDLTADQFSELSETLDALWTSSREARTVDLRGQKEDLDEAAATVVAAGAENKTAKPLGVTGQPAGFDLVRHGWRSLRSLVVRPENWAWRLDGGKDGGVFTRYFWRPVRDAVNRFVVDKTRYTLRLAKMVQDLHPKLKQGMIEFRDRNGDLLYTFGKGNGGFGQAELIGALLHTGNASNLRKLLVGRGWGTYDAEADLLDSGNWDAFVNQMVQQGLITKDVMDFVQRVWDLAEELKPMAQEAHKKITGFRFKEIDAVPVQTPWGTYRGGYVPAKLDPFAKSAKRVESLNEMAKDFRNQVASTGRGFTKSRVEAFAEPLNLNIDLIPSHIDDVLRFAHLQPVIRDVQKLAQHREVMAELNRVQPGVWNDFLLPWLQTTANQSVTKKGMSPVVDRFWSGVRSSAGLTMMMGNAINALQQFTNLLTAALKVRPGYLMQGLFRTLQGGARAEIAELSPGFMGHRFKNSMLEALDNVDDLMVNRSKFAKGRAWVKRHAYFLQTFTQNLIDPVVWQGAYLQTLAELDKTVSPEEAKAEAVQRADAAVRVTQGSFDPTDLARFESGSPFYRLFAQFNGWFNAMANLQADQFVRVARATGWGSKVGIAFQAYTLGFFVPLVLADALAKLAKGRVDDPDDNGLADDFLLHTLFLGHFQSLATEIPLVGGGINTVISKITGEGFSDKMISTPAISLLESGVGGMVRTVNDAKSAEKEITGADVRDVATALSFMFGVPAGGVLGRYAGYGYDVNRGKVTPTARGWLTASAAKTERKR